MRKMILLFTAAAAMLSCSKSDDMPGKKFNENAYLYINGASKLKAAVVGHLSDAEIVRKTTVMASSLKGKPDYLYTMTQCKDTVNNRFRLPNHLVTGIGGFNSELMNGEDVVFVWHQYNKDSTDVVRGDTIAYIPNSVMKEAYQLVKSAYDRGDYEECYRIMEQRFYFLPITGEEWRKLKAEGKN